MSNESLQLATMRELKKELVAAFKDAGLPVTSEGRISRTPESGYGIELWVDKKLSEAQTRPVNTIISLAKELGLRVDYSITGTSPVLDGVQYREYLAARKKLSGPR